MSPIAAAIAPALVGSALAPTPANAQGVATDQMLETVTVTSRRIGLDPTLPSTTLSITADRLAGLARLAAQVPPPRMHLTRYHGVFAPHSQLRAPWR